MESRRPRRTPPRVLAGTAALVVAAVVGVAGCSTLSAGAPSPTSSTASLSAVWSPPTTAPPVPSTSSSTPAPPPGIALDAGAAQPLARSVPVRLLIPAIGVDSTLMELGLHDDGTMEVPPAGFPAGWYTGAPTPGELGPAVIAGHVDWTGPGVFYDLHTLVAGDEVRVERTDGSTAVFRVTKVEEYRKSAFPTDEVYGDIAFAGLRLITCGGSFNKRTGHYEDNIVAFAELVG
ncbi:class F sortase [Cellulomonas sp. WB94]|nr:class F sortase [Cellulomonas sp. WB94]